MALVACALPTAVAVTSSADTTFPPCDQEMTTCPCNGVRVDRNLIQANDLLMIRLEGTPVVSFPFKVQ